MNRLKPESIPEVLTEDIIILLAHMAMEFPVTHEWKAVAKILSIDKRILVNNKISEIMRNENELRKASLSNKEKAAEEAKWERIRNDLDPHKFYGNMGQPTTVEEYKNRYGVYPPGYDKDGNKIYN